MCRSSKQLGFMAALLAVFVSVVPLLAPVSADGSPDGWAPHESGTTLALYGVCGGSSSEVFACGYGGIILRHDGSGWNPMTTGVTSPIYSLSCASTDSVFAVGNAGTIVSYNGTSWNQMVSGTSNHLNAVWAAAPDDVFAVGNVGTILHYDGLSWSPLASGTTSHLRGIWAASPTDVFAVGNGGTILHYDGISWTPMSCGVRAKLYGVWGAAPDEVLAVGEGGTIVRYDGVSWVELSCGVVDSLNGIWGTSKNDIFVVGGNGLILHYDGSWRLMNSGTLNVLYGVWGASSLDVHAVGAGGTILHYNDSPPVVTTVAPNRGCPSETLSVVITGSNLSGATVVDFGVGVTVTGFTVNSATQITADISIAAGATLGARGVSVTTPGGTDALSGGFTVLAAPPVPPVVTDVVPGSGVCGTGLVVVITGSNLSGATVVDFGVGVTVTGFEVDGSGTQIMASITIDANATPGRRDVLVETAGGSTVLDGGLAVLIRFSYITDVSPGSGMIGDTLDVVISGENLDAVTAVDFGAGIEVNSFGVTSASQMTVRIIIKADAKAGYRDVTIVTPWSNYSHLEGFAVRAVPPGVVSISQTAGRLGQEIMVTIEGTNLVGVTRVSFGPGIEVEGFDMYPPSSVRVRIRIAPDAEIGTRDVSVTTAPGGTYVFENAFEIEGTETSTRLWSPIGAAVGAVLIAISVIMLRRPWRANGH